MNDNGRAKPRRSRIWVLGVTLLLVVIIVISRGRHRDVMPPIASAFPGDASAHLSVPPAANAKPPAIKFHRQGVDFTVEICGFGKVPMDADDPLAPGRYVGEITHNAGKRWLAALLDSDDIRARSAGLFLKDTLAGDGSAISMDDQTRDSLVQLAVGAGDPAIYAMAVYACNTYSVPTPTGSCQQITLNTWSSLDPNNAVPWLLLAGKAHAMNDHAAEAAAFSQAAGATRTDAYNFSLYTYAELEMPADVTPLERWYMSTKVVGIEAATASLHYHVAGQYCSATAMSDDGIHRQCEALAELLVHKGTNLLDLSFGTNIGARAGWSQKIVAGLTEERDALLQARMQDNPGGNNDDSWTCDGARRGNAYMDEWARLGELGAARESVERSRRSVSELAQMQRNFMEKIRLNLQQRTEAPATESTP